MICPACHANLNRRGAGGDTLLKARGVVVRANGVILICPRCKADVPMGPEEMQRLHKSAVLFFRGSPGAVS